MTAVLTLDNVTTRDLDGLAVRVADSGEQRPATLLMTNPWPESLLAYRRIWSTLAPYARLVAIDLPGFGHSQGRRDLLSPPAMAQFLKMLIDEWDLDRPHVLAPDVGTSAALFLAARYPDSIGSIIVGSGGAAYPLQVTGTLADIIWP
jgi:pimeloyl-ACP methyl ester carboxylesterase